MNSRLLFPGGVVVGLRGVKHLVTGLLRLGGVSGVSGIVVSQPGVTGVTGAQGAAEVEGWAEGAAAGGGGGGCKEQEWIL